MIDHGTKYMIDSINSRLEDIEDALLSYFALIAAQSDEALEDPPASQEELEAAQKVFAGAMDRMRSRMLARR